jgi:uncharacterized BrkB/YihY/UPF0761 family membrane protein
MIDREFRHRFAQEVKNLIPLFRYLILQTETHAFCLALAGAALLGFFPACLVMLAVFKNLLRWQGAYDILLTTVQAYFPVDPKDYISRNLSIRLAQLGRRTELTSLLWVLLGAAGVFIPLETGLNRLWKVQHDRPYWLNQIVGFTLTLVCTAFGLTFLSISTALHALVKYLPFEIVRVVMRLIVIRTTMTCLFVVSIFALYKFLPNTKIDARQVLPAAILAGVMAEFVRIIYVHAIPQLGATQGPFATSVTFLLLAYFESFVLLGCAFLASQTERYPWMGFLKRKRSDSSLS